MKRWIHAATYNGFDGSDFDEYQMEEISKGLESGVDVSVYADPEYGHMLMREIREGLEKGLDVSIYADPKYHLLQMEEIRKGLEQGLDVSSYADPNYTPAQMREIREGLEKGVSLDYNRSPKYAGDSIGNHVFVSPEGEEMTLDEICTEAIDYVNDSDRSYELDDPESFSEEVWLYIKNNYGINMTDAESDYVLDMASSGDFDF